jgi:hypothetical protein
LATLKVLGFRWVPDSRWVPHSRRVSGMGLATTTGRLKEPYRSLAWGWLKAQWVWG